MSYLLQTSIKQKLLIQLCSVVAGIFFLLPSQAQSSAVDSNSNRFYQQAYQSRIAGSSFLFNGPEYTAFYPETNGSPFLSHDKLDTGSVWYDGIFYRNVLLQLNLVDGLLITKSFQGLNMVLSIEKTDSFTLGQRKFVRRQSSSLPLGYYEKLLDDGIVVLAKRSRQSVRSLHVEEGNHFVDRNRYFIEWGNQVYQPTSKRSLLSIFHTQSKELKKFWKEEKLDYKKDPEKAIVRIAWWFTQQNKGR
jgi:hypothetical protein